MAPHAELASALEEFARHERVIVALDFDGTLSPLVADPSQARPTPAAATVLPRLAAHPRVELALVSGRDGQTLAELATPPTDTHLIGSHGAQIGTMGASGFSAEDLALTPAQQEALAEVRSQLEEIAAQHPDTWVEHKPAAAALHTRTAEEPAATAATQAALAGPAQLPATVTLQGKSVVEIGVLTATKGDAITQLRTTLGGIPVLFMGDDVTDEHAFAVLNDGNNGRADQGDISIKVGAGTTEARFRVNDPHEVAQTLELLAKLLASPNRIR